jgi:hypothetical protein
MLMKCGRVQEGTANATTVPAKSVASIKDALKHCSLPVAHLPEAAQRAHAEACKMHAVGRMIVVATLTGELCLYENSGSPQWM